MLLSEYLLKDETQVVIRKQVYKELQKEFLECNINEIQSAIMLCLPEAIEKVSSEVKTWQVNKCNYIESVKEIVQVCKTLCKPKLDSIHPKAYVHDRSFKYFEGKL